MAHRREVFDMGDESDIAAIRRVLEDSDDGEDCLDDVSDTDEVEH